jgi:hypothetical protein
MDDSQLFNSRFEYGWRFFDFHAKQRTTIFNFFVVFSGFLIGAFAILLQKNEHWPLVILSLFGAVITFFFIFLERRNEELVHIAEDILRALEQEVLFRGMRDQVKWPHQRTRWRGRMIESLQPVPVGIFVRQDYDEHNDAGSKYSHGTWMPGVQLLVCGLCVVTAIYAFLLGVGALPHTSEQQLGSPAPKITVTVEQHP